MQMPEAICRKDGALTGSASRLKMICHSHSRLSALSQTLRPVASLARPQLAKYIAAPGLANLIHCWTAFVLTYEPAVYSPGPLHDLF